MLHAVIMAGGSGTRFWPASRKRTPKQLLRLVGERTMIQSTVDRLAGLVPPRQTLVVTNRQQLPALAEQLPELPASSLLGEPCKRDTAPCIALAASIIAREDPDATMLVMPSDHVIRSNEAFHEAVRLGERLLAEYPQRLVTFGIRPTYAAETFGYIERGAPLELPGAQRDAPKVYEVRQFKEKPRAITAREYLEQGTFYWNAGIFLWKATTILAELARSKPRLVEGMQYVAAARGTAAFATVLEREFTAAESISIDYAVLEQSANVAVIEAPFAWDDVGSWQSLARLQGANEQGNTIEARHLGIRTSGTIVRGPDDHLIVTLGLQDCIVVHTPDATLVANKRDEEAVRELVKLIEEQGWEEYL